MKRIYIPESVSDHHKEHKIDIMDRIFEIWEKEFRFTKSWTAEPSIEHTQIGIDIHFDSMKINYMQINPMHLHELFLNAIEEDLI